MEKWQPNGRLLFAGLASALFDLKSEFRYVYVELLCA